MSYFDNKNLMFEDETWFDEMHLFFHWITKQGNAEYVKYRKFADSRPRGQMIVPQDSPHWHISRLFPDFETAYAAYLEDVNKGS